MGKQSSGCSFQSYRKVSCTILAEAPRPEGCFPFVQFGFDPGAKGGWAALDQDGRVLGHGKLFDFEEAVKGISGVLNRAKSLGIAVFGAFESNHAMPHDSKRSIRSFGSNTGESIGLLKSLGFWPMTMVPPQYWQHRMRCQTGGNKRITLDKASLLFQGEKITHYTADALLIAEDARRQRVGAGLPV